MRFHFKHILTIAPIRILSSCVYATRVHFYTLSYHSVQNNLPTAEFKQTLFTFSKIKITNLNGCQR